ncbi:cytochrome d ubiquinol oxidase subunit II [Arcanobacterium hippocoleae]|uniref:Cytochrome d ubiquinol oxidase subunit II n=1 Tax=Arcanobacterium hippocoleae TaxID=149017 RepID=A0ABU1T416_9ACTO|nr:cytochrome d ubiquinol oxidase subunit II [Arcanobacterium hippocoleae]MDR6940134.1 cytochrome d ubiquinol oxidase subunit II [Arcanobacterium hippocoleae]
MELTALQIIWFVLIIVLWIGYVTLEGFGFGAAMNLHGLAKDEKDRRLILNTIGPHWDGNEVFLLTAGGATFAAFPEWYATMFSGMYLALVVVLLLLIVRISAIEWRGKIDSAKWRNAWDNLHFGASWLVSILWGVAFANFVQGMTIEIGKYENGAFQASDKADISGALADGAQHFLTGGFFSLLTPFTILGGIAVALLFFNHGTLWLALKTAGDFHKRALKQAKTTGLISTAVTAIWAIWGQLAYHVNWYSWIPLLLAAVLLICSALLALKENEKGAFFVHSAALAVAVIFIFLTLGANAIKSTIDPAYHLTLAQASATGPTHTVMLIAAIIFVPIVLVYTVWSYLVFAQRISRENIPDTFVGLDLHEIRKFEKVNY